MLVRVRMIRATVTKHRVHLVTFKITVFICSQIIIIHLVGEGHTGSDDVSAVRRGRNGKTILIGVGLLLGNQDADLLEQF